MGSLVLGGGSKVDKTACVPFGSYSGSFTTSATNNTWTTAVSVSGHGYLEWVNFMPPSGININIRITLDGVVRVVFGLTAGYQGWVVCRSALTDTGAGNLGFPSYGSMSGGSAISSPIFTYPFPYTGATMDSGNTMVIAPGDGMYFTQSLLIEFMAPNNVSQIVSLAYAGGSY